MKTIQRITSVVVLYLVSVFFCCWGAFNVYAYEAVNVKIPVDCLDNPSTDAEKYLIKIEAESETEWAPTPKNDILEIVSNEDACFEIVVTQPGTFTYKIFEIAGNDNNIDYDNKIYYVTLFVENSVENDLIYSVIANADGRGSKSETIKFENKVLGERDTANRTSVASTSTISSTAVTTTVSTQIITKPNKPDTNKITKAIDTVLTGDSFPAHTIRCVLVIALAAAILTFLFKRKNNEEEGNKNE